MKLGKAGSQKLAECTSYYINIVSKSKPPCLLQTCYINFKPTQHIKCLINLPLTNFLPLIKDLQGVIISLSISLNRPINLPIWFSYSSKPEPTEGTSTSALWAQKPALINRHPSRDIYTAEKIIPTFKRNSCKIISLLN